MPLVAIALGAYLAGLLAGFSGSALLILAIVVAALIVGTGRGRAVSIGLAALAAAGAGVAHTSVRDEGQCAVAAMHRDPLVLVLGDSASPGAFVAGHAVGCDARVSLGVQHGSAAAGTAIAVTGDVVQSQRGWAVQHATIHAVAGPSLMERWRRSAGAAIDRTFTTDAPLVRALLIADRRGLSPEVRDQFAAAGMAHVLAIAGLHIGIIALALLLALESAGVARRRASAIAMLVVVFYVVLIGAPIPAVRSAAMLSTLVLCRLAQRPASRWAIVAIGASQPVLAPGVVLDVGYQLSVIGVAAMIAASQLSRRIGAHRLKGFAAHVATGMIGTTIATIASAPIVAWVFGRVSVVAPLTNVVAAPLLALVQPMLFCGMVVSPFHALASLFADAAHPLLASLTGVAAAGAGVPHGAVQVSPTVGAAVIAGVLSIATIVACVARDWQRPTAIAAAAAAALAWWPLLPASSGLTELHVIDVGQGDAIALRTPHAHWILIDAGRAWRGGDAGRSTIIPYLARRGGTLDVFVLSHPHTDHVGGASSVLHALHPREYVDGGFPGPAESYRESLDAARDEHVRWVRAHPGDSLAIDGVSLTFLAPDSAWTSHLDDPNLASVVTLIQVGAVRMLLMGDAERPEEEWLLEHESGQLHADILKVGHHGSSTSSTPEFLDAVSPRLALVSVGAGNSYHLPSMAIMRSLAARGAQVLRTDHLGTIVARTDGESIFVDAGGDEWQLPESSKP
jgi:competence protein ComEC